MSDADRLVLPLDADERDALGAALNIADLPAWTKKAAYGLFPGNGGLHPDRARDLYRLLYEVDVERLPKPQRQPFRQARATLKTRLDDRAEGTTPRNDTHT